DIGQSDKATLAPFRRYAQEPVPAPDIHPLLEDGVHNAKDTHVPARYRPALEVAACVLAGSAMRRGEPRLLSADQRPVCAGSGAVKLSTVSVAAPKATNISVPSVQLVRSTFSGRERVTITAGVSNKSDAPATNIPVTLQMDGQKIEAQNVTVPANASASVSFQ